jgi:hypothetical protein
MAKGAGVGAARRDSSLPRAGTGVGIVVAVVAGVVIAGTVFPQSLERQAPAAGIGMDCPGAQVLHAGLAVVCTHGDDNQFRSGTAGGAAGEQDAADALVSAATAASSRQLTARPIPCRGDGSSGNRVAFYYAYIAGHPDRIASVRQLLVTAIDQANDIVYQSARQTGGYRWLRVLTDRYCTPIIATIRLPSAAADSFATTISDSHLSAVNRKYVLFVDTDHYCGLGTLSLDDSAGVMNQSNTGPSWARLDNGCWRGAPTAHEIFHMLGAVQSSAAHYDGTGHCTDDYDLMCYQNPGGKKNYVRCANRLGAVRADCGKDDYFNTAPRAGSYLSRHWNTARSSFLYGGGPARPVIPAAVRSAGAAMTTLSSARVHWSAPPGRVTAYTLAKDGVTVWKGTATSWTDHNASFGQHTYQVRAVNEAGAGPWSPALGATLTRPPAPTSVGAASGTVTWTAYSALAVGFGLYGLSSNGTATHLNDQPASARSASDNTLFLFRSWNRYRVCAYNQAGQSCRDQT